MNNSKVLALDQAHRHGIAKNLQTLLRSRGVSESELARALNTSVMTIRRIVSGETEDPRISTLSLIAEYFNVSIDSLLSDHNHMPINMMTKKNPQFIPILDWETIEDNLSIQNINLSEWKDWYPIVSETSYIDDLAFAIESRPSMQPRFPNGTLFIINPNEIPRDGDIILIKMKEEQKLSLRELVVDSPRWQLQPIVTGSETMFFDDSKQSILGVVILTLLHTRK